MAENENIIEIPDSQNLDPSTPGEIGGLQSDAVQEESTEAGPAGSPLPDANVKTSEPESEASASVMKSDIPIPENVGEGKKPVTSVTQPTEKDSSPTHTVVKEVSTERIEKTTETVKEPTIVKLDVHLETKIEDARSTGQGLPTVITPTQTSAKPPASSDEKFSDLMKSQDFSDLHGYRGEMYGGPESYSPYATVGNPFTMTPSQASMYQQVTGESIDPSLIGAEVRQGELNLPTEQTLEQAKKVTGSSESPVYTPSIPSDVTKTEKEFSEKFEKIITEMQSAGPAKTADVISKSAEGETVGAEDSESRVLTNSINLAVLKAANEATGESNVVGSVPSKVASSAFYGMDEEGPPSWLVKATDNANAIAASPVNALQPDGKPIGPSPESEATVLGTGAPSPGGGKEEVEVKRNASLLTPETKARILQSDTKVPLDELNQTMRGVQGQLGDIKAQNVYNSQNTTNSSNSTTLVNNPGTTVLQGQAPTPPPVKEEDGKKEEQESSTTMLEFYLHGIYDLLASQGIRIKTY